MDDGGTMHESDLSLLDSNALARRLAELAGAERELQVDFLVHLDEYDRRRNYVADGYASLWDFLTKALHYREGATHRRICAMRALRRVPNVADALRDGRLCLTTLATLEKVLTPENAGDLVPRAAFRSKLEVEQIVAALQPRVAPTDGIRRIAAAGQVAAAGGAGQRSGVAPRRPALFAAPACDTLVNAEDRPDVADVSFGGGVPEPADPPASRRPTLQPITADEFSLRVTIDAELKADLDTLKALLSHKVPNGDLRAVLREAVRCGIEKHGRRKGAVEPARKRATPAAVPAPSSARSPSRPARRPTAEVRRQVWKRDGGRCAWIGPDARRCGSTWQLEFDHIEAAALGGSATIENGRLLCRSHNMAHAETTFGRETMDLFRSSAAVP
jgi:hypothetical protein